MRWLLICTNNFNKQKSYTTAKSGAAVGIYDGNTTTDVFEKSLNSFSDCDIKNEYRNCQKRS